MANASVEPNLTLLNSIEVQENRGANTTASSQPNQAVVQCVRHDGTSRYQQLPPVPHDEPAV
ncbi:hypothetical protein [Trichocoleus sp. DQ-U1]|uniref:hypothetical protein n=1 Tax=Trichocoleus sp. DQ-U1 TaxID=2933926 RepID=UPI003296863D